MLEGVFSSYGLLHLLQIRPNASLAQPGFFALVKFYSAAQAAAAQQGTDGRTLFQRSPLKVDATAAVTAVETAGVTDCCYCCCRHMDR